MWTSSDEDFLSETFDGTIDNGEVLTCTCDTITADIPIACKTS